MYGLERRAGQGLVALCLASLGSYTFGATTGWLLAPHLPIEARSLLFAVALLLTGLHMLARTRPTPTLLGRPTVASSLWQFIRSQFGDDSQFLVFAVAAKSGSPALAVAGGLAGMLVAGFLPMAMGKDWPAGRLKWVRRGAGIVLAVAGFLLGISAMKLTNAF
jgi:Ca2+/H+ antiporter, TMEM165/GDT1 family